MHLKWIDLGVNWWRNSVVMIACLHQDAEIWCWAHVPEIRHEFLLRRAPVDRWYVHGHTAPY